MGTMLINSDDSGHVRSDEVEAEEGPQADVDDWEGYWKDSELDDFCSTLDLDALSSSNPG